MLGVIGTSDVAVSVAAYAASQSSQRVALCASSVDSAVSAERYQVRGPGGTSQVELSTEWDFVADAYVAIAEGPALRGLLSVLRKQLSGKPLLLAPGNVGGCATVISWFRQWGLEAPVVAEVPGFPVIGAVSDHEVTIRAVKQDLPCGGLTPTHAPSEFFRAWFPELVPSTCLDTGLANTNHVIHPPLVLANTTTIERAETRRFYREGLSPAGCELIRRVDQERLAITDSLGLERRSVEDWLVRYYGDQGMAGSTLEELLGNFPGFADGLAPTTLRYRYLDEDLTHGLAPLEAVARFVDVRTPTISALVTTLGAMTGKDYRLHAVTLARALLCGPEAASLSVA